MSAPKIKTTTVGSYSPIDWLAALPGEQAVIDATSVVINTQKRAGIDLPTDGELYRFDPNHPDTDGMIEYFVGRLGGIRSEVGRSDGIAFRAKQEMSFRRKPAAVVVDEISEGTLDLFEACERSASVALGPGRVKWVHPDCGFWMLKRSVADRKIEALVAGRDRFLGR